MVISTFVPMVQLEHLIYQLLSHTPPEFSCGVLDAKTFVQKLDDAYSILVHWSNFFAFPLGMVGKAFVSDHSPLCCAFTEGSVWTLLP